MDRTPVNSSNIKSVGYDPETSTLEVEFVGGGVYRYEDVATSAYTKLMAADSVGRHFHTNIRARHKHVRAEKE